MSLVSAAMDAQNFSSFESRLDHVSTEVDHRIWATRVLLEKSQQVLDESRRNNHNYCQTSVGRMFHPELIKPPFPPAK